MQDDWAFSWTALYTSKVDQIGLEEHRRFVSSSISHIHLTYRLCQNTDMITVDVEIDSYFVTFAGRFGRMPPEREARGNSHTTYCLALGLAVILWNPGMIRTLLQRGTGRSENVSPWLKICH